MKPRTKPFPILAALAGALLLAGPAGAEGIVSGIVNAPLSAAGTARDGRVGINVHLEIDEASGPDFIDPKVLGYGLGPGGRLEIEMVEGFERDWAVPLGQTAIMLVTGAPQQGLPGDKVGYEVTEGDNENTFVIRPTAADGLPFATLMSPAPGAGGDPIRQRGIKVLHIGFMQSAFYNRGERGKVEVRFYDSAGKIVDSGSGTVDFLAQPVPQVLPTNFTDGRRNHNWQRIGPGRTLGRDAGTLPLALMLYAKAPAGKAGNRFREGIVGAGVLSTRQLKAMRYVRPNALLRYDGGLVIQDGDGDGKLDPRKDTIIGGVIGKAPAGASGQELRSLERDGEPVLSQASADIVSKAGKRWGGAIMQLQFKAGNLTGKYRPTIALLSQPGKVISPDGSAFTYTVVVE